MVDKYIPRQGDICYVDFTPTISHEQTGFRHAIVISKNVYNQLTNMVVLCPITSNVKNFPTHF